MSFLLFLNYWLILPAVIAQMFNPIPELATAIGRQTKEAKAEMETYPVIVEITISQWSIEFKTLKIFCASYSLIYFD